MRSQRGPPTADSADRQAVFCKASTDVAVVSSHMAPALLHTSRQYLGGELQLGKQILWPLVRKQTIPTERPPLVDET
jgi:hypothetical protein